MSSGTSVPAGDDGFGPDRPPRPRPSLVCADPLDRRHRTRRWSRRVAVARLDVHLSSARRTPPAEALTGHAASPTGRPRRPPEIAGVGGPDLEGPPADLGRRIPRQVTGLVRGGCRSSPGWPWSRRGDVPRQGLRPAGSGPTTSCSPRTAGARCAGVLCEVGARPAGVRRSGSGGQRRPGRRGAARRDGASSRLGPRAWPAGGGQSRAVRPSNRSTTGRSPAVRYGDAVVHRTAACRPARAGRRSRPATGPLGRRMAIATGALVVGRRGHAVASACDVVHVSRDSAPVDDDRVVGPPTGTRMIAAVTSCALRRP